LRAAAAPVAEGAIDPLSGQVWGDAPSLVQGWVLFAEDSVARVEVLVDGVALGLARPGRPRPDISEWAPQAEAAVCGFDHMLLPRDLPPGVDEVRIGAIAHGPSGAAWALPEQRFAIRSVRGDPDVGAEPDAAERLHLELRHLRLRVRQAGARGPAPPKHPVKLLAFTHDLAEYGGAPLYLVELLRRLQSGLAGFECCVVSFGDGGLRDVLEAMRIPVHLSEGPSHLNPVAYEGRLCELAAWAAPQGFNVVLANSMGTFAAVDLASRLDVPAVWAYHEGFEPVEWWSRVYGEPPHPYIWRRVRGAFRSAAAVIFGAESTRRELLGYGSEARFVSVPYGIAIDDIEGYQRGFERQEARRRLGISDSATVVLSLATIEPRKGQTSLAMAFAALAQEHPDAVLVLVGETGQDWTEPYVSGLREYIARAGLEERVVIAPVTRDPHEWIGIADVLVLASDAESLPLVVLQGMAFGVPVVSTAVSGLPELIHDGHSGYLCEPRDPADLTAALARALAASAEQRRAVGEAGAAVARERHDSRRQAHRLERLLSALAADPHADVAGAAAERGASAARNGSPAGHSPPGGRIEPPPLDRELAEWGDVPPVRSDRANLLPPLELWELDHSWEEFFSCPTEYLAYLTLLCDLRVSDAVLEIGCHMGRTMLGLWDYLRPPGRYEGLDVSAAHIHFATEHIHRIRPHFRFTLADVRHPRFNPSGTVDAADFTFPYPAGSFDVVYAASVFTHLLEPAAANYLEQSRRVLKPTGRCLFSFMLLDYYEQARAAGVHPEWEVPHRLEDTGGVAVADTRHPEDLVAYELEEIHRLAASAGLTVERVLPGSWSNTHKKWVHYLDLVLLAPASRG
jgi:glycosyltransferase involved in cell wall biosynthesis/SAM-dependent methyltransferase